jgi:hypothetical protein
VIITVDGGSPRTCTFQFPLAGGSQSAECGSGGGVSILVSPMQDCRTTNHGDYVSVSCSSIPGKFREQLTVSGLPGNLRIIQRLAGGPPYLERQVTPGYQDVYPNGKQCGPVC